MADSKNKGQVPFPRDVESLKPIDKTVKLKRKREKSASAVNLATKSRIERSKLRHQFKADFQKHTGTRLQNVDQLEDYINTKQDQRKSEIKVNSGCVFFNSQHREKVQELTIKQVLSGLEKNYLKFKDHYSSLVKKNPAIIKETELPCIIELREREAKEAKESTWQKLDKQRPNSVEYLVNDEYAHRHLTQLEKEEQATLMTQQDIINNYEKPVHPGVFVNKNFVPPLKVTTRALPKLKDSQVIVVDDTAMRPAAHRRQAESIEEKKRPTGLQSIPARMSRLYRSKYGDLLVDLSMRTRITGRMINQIKDRFEISQREKDMQPGKEQNTDVYAGGTQGTGPERETGPEGREERGSQKPAGERGGRENVKDKEVLADFMQLLRVSESLYRKKHHTMKPNWIK